MKQLDQKTINSILKLIIYDESITVSEIKKRYELDEETYQVLSDMAIPFIRKNNRSNRIPIAKTKLNLSYIPSAVTTWREGGRNVYKYNRLPCKHPINLNDIERRRQAIEYKWNDMLEEKYNLAQMLSPENGIYYDTDELPYGIEKIFLDQQIYKNYIQKSLTNIKVYDTMVMS